MKKKNILFVSGFVCDTLSPIETMSIHLSNALGEDFGVVWLVPTIANPYNRYAYKENRHKLSEPLFVSELEKSRIPSVQGNLSKYNVVKNLLLLWTVFRKYHIDAVLTQFGFERFYVTFLAKLFFRRTIWYEHWYSLGTKYIFLKKIFYFLFVDYFIAVSGHIASTLPKGKKIFTVRNAISVATAPLLSESQKAAAKQRLGLEHLKSIVVMVAAFRPEKRHDIAIQIIETVCRKADRDTGFVLLGDGPLFPLYKGEIERRGFRERVVMPGHRLNVKDYLSVSDALMLTSLYEGLPICLLEGMNFRLPLIAFDTNWSREVITDGDNGYLIPPEDVNKFSETILALLSNPALRELIGRRGYEHFKTNFEISSWKQRMREVFREILT